jgi:putative oxidoreductase
MAVGRMLLRVVVGGLFVGHGTQKLFGWFGGAGLSGTAKSMREAGLQPSRANAVAAGCAETGGGALLLLGLETPLAAASLSSVMLTAIRAVHLEKGPWSSEGGYEYPLALVATLFALTESGPGAVSLDARRGRQRRGLGWAVAQLGAAALGSHAVIAAGRRQSAARPVTPESPQFGDSVERLRAA